MNAVFNKDSMMKASKWLVLALFGLVLVVLKFVWNGLIEVFFGNDDKPSYDPMRAGIDPDYDDDGFRY